MTNLIISIFSLMISATPPTQFVFNNGAEPETLDPHRMSAHNDALLAMNLFEGLLMRDAAYDKLQPGLASALPEISKDGLTYTFTLRRNLKWSNGEPLTVEHVRGSFIRSLDPLVACPYIAWLNDNIVGAEDLAMNYKSADRLTLEAKLGIQIKGKNKIEFKLKKPNVSFASYFTQQGFFIVHPSMYDTSAKAWTDPKAFVTNGTYKLKEWTVNKQIILEKNPNYYDAARAKISEVVALPVADHQTSYNLFKSQQIDWAGNNSISSSMVPSLRANSDFYLSPNFGTYTYVFNLKRKPFDDIRVRKALALAIHRAEITDKILKGGQIPSSRFVPPGVEGYKPAIEPPAPYDKQLDDAKRLLAEAGFPDGKGFPKVTVLYNTNEGHHKIAQAVQQMWKKNLGIDVRLENMEWKVLLKEQAAKNFDIVRQSWIGDAPDPYQMLEIYMTKDGNNHASYSNAEFDRIMENSRSIKDKAKRFNELVKAEKIVLEQLPAVPIYHYVWYGLISPRVDGFKPNMFGLYQFKYFTKK